MKKQFLCLASAAAVILAGCATVAPQRIDNIEKRLAALEDTTKPLQQEKEIKSLSADTAPAAVAIQAPETPTKKDIQAALKNAGVYDGDVDGKLGPKTKKAIEAFQAAHDLNVDGRVGPNTWEKLKAHYQPVAETSQK